MPSKSGRCEVGMVAFMQSMQRAKKPRINSKIARRFPWLFAGRVRRAFAQIARNKISDIRRTIANGAADLHKRDSRRADTIFRQIAMVDVEQAFRFTIREQAF